MSQSGLVPLKKGFEFFDKSLKGRKAYITTRKQADIKRYAAEGRLIGNARKDDLIQREKTLPPLSDIVDIFRDITEVMGDELKAAADAFDGVPLKIGTLCS